MTNQHQRSLDETQTDEAATGHVDQEQTEEAGEVVDTGEEAIAFEEAIEELETIVQELEDGSLGLEEAMARFERGLSLVTTCRSKLQQAELKVQELLEDGSVVPAEDQD